MTKLNSTRLAGTLLLLAAVCLTPGCARPQLELQFELPQPTLNEPQQSKEVPEMRLEYVIDSLVCEVMVTPGTCSWSYDNGDGTSTGLEADSPHPLDMLGIMSEILNYDDLFEITVSFTFTPGSYSVFRWPDEYLGHPDRYDILSEPVGMANNTLVLPKDGIGYVYMVHAIWPQGNAVYAFYVPISS